MGKSNNLLGDILAILSNRSNIKWLNKECHSRYPNSNSRLVLLKVTLKVFSNRVTLTQVVSRTLDTLVLKWLLDRKVSSRKLYKCPLSKCRTCPWEEGLLRPCKDMDNSNRNSKHRVLCRMVPQDHLCRVACQINLLCSGSMLDKVTICCNSNSRNSRLRSQGCSKRAAIHNNPKSPDRRMPFRSNNRCNMLQWEEHSLHVV
mmetsp:Transcript_8087/g.16094  ORF Transcript_8087/g.16094 Transcript_8087/m.16094 type:complete len:202 (+) Transcript_8087:371-976(+)